MELLSGLRLTDGGSTNFFGQLKRYLDITNNQGSATRKRWLISNFRDGSLYGAYWGLRSATGKYPNAPEGYPEKLAENVIANVRTDFDAFSKAEISVLENQGYLVGDAAIRGHVSELIQGEPAPREVPNPDWMDANRVRDALSESGETKMLGRGWP